MAAMRIAAMEMRLEGVKRRLDNLSNVEQLQEEQGRMLQNLSRQMKRLLQDRSVSRARGRDFRRRAETQGRTHVSTSQVREEEEENSYL